MGITAVSGPTISYGVATAASTNGLTGQVSDYNDQRAPSLSDLGYALMDPRVAYNYDPAGSVSNKVLAFYDNRANIDVVPVAASTVAFVAAITASSSLGSTALTLQAGSSARGTYAATLVAPESGATITSLLAVGSSAESVYNVFGTTGTVCTWNPGADPGRVVSIVTSSGGDSAVTVHGRDMYGYKVSEAISIGNALSLTASYGGVGQKAFKYIDGITWSSAPTSTGILGIGFCDRYGFPLFVPYYGMNVQVQVSSAATVGNTLVALTSVNAVLGSTTTATATTADPRGTFISSVGSSLSYRIQIKITPSASAVCAVSASDVSPLFGVTQYSS